jgi:hypothetical protein
MQRGDLKAAIDQVLLALNEERGGDPENWEEVPTPECLLDMETYELLVKRTGQTRYPELFTQAVRSMKSLLTPEQLRQIALAVKSKRSRRRHKTVHSRIEKGEFGWVIDTAREMGTKPARILESVLFIYLRADALDAPRTLIQA